jgi:hypothetical protein
MLGNSGRVMKSVAASHIRMANQKKPAPANAMMRERRSRSSMKIAATSRGTVLRC